MTFGALYIQCHLRHHKAKGHSASVLFLDSHAAYYRVIRELSVGHIESDEAACRVFHFFQIDPDDVRAFMEDIRHGGMMSQAGLSSPLRHQVKDILYNSWFVTRYGDHRRLCATKAGSRPGESWADLVFAFVLGRILCQITELATGEGLLSELFHDLEGGPFVRDPSRGSVLAQDCTWADDCSWPMMDRCPDRLMTKTARMCSLVLDYSERHGMRPNLKAGKTALLIALRGAGAAATRKKWFPAGVKHVHVKDLDMKVQVAAQYVHLDGLVDPDLRLQAEARRRAAIAATAYDSGKKLLFGNASIPLAVRVSLFQTYVGSTLFNLGLWIPSGPSWATLEGGYTKVLRGLLTTKFKGDALYKVVAPATHILTKSWPLSIMARKARLSRIRSAAIWNG